MVLQRTVRQPGPRLGLCCLFRDEPIKFRTTTATANLRLSRTEQLHKLAELCQQNAHALLAAIAFCAEHQIGAFRVNSQFWPLKTHPQAGYRWTELPRHAAITSLLGECREAAEKAGVRLSFHPDQFVVLNSPRDEVVVSSLQELEYQAEAAEWIGADVVNIHAGGAYGDKPAALERLQRNLDRLSERARQRLTLENDDRTYTPAELLPLCRAAAVPLCYDVHHHRCLPDGESVAATTAAACKTWEECATPREPLFHLSSPRDGWQQPQPQFHHDFIDLRDFPRCWRKLNVTIDVEAKAKEVAVLKLWRDLYSKA